MEFENGKTYNWKKVKIGDVLSEIKTGTTPPKKIAKYYQNKDIDWFSPSDFRDKKELTNPKNKVDNSALADGKIKLYKPNSLLLIAIGNTIGKIGISRKETSSNQQVTGLTFNKEIKVDFSYYWFLKIKHLIIKRSSSATLPIINQKGIKDLPFLYPPLPEQKRIVTKLDALFERIDKAIALLEENIRKTEEFSKSLLYKIFEGKFVIQKKNESPARVFLDGILEKKSQFSTKKKKTTKPEILLKSAEELPFGWEKIRLGDFTSINTGATPLTSNKDYYDGDIPWITSRATNKLFVEKAEKNITQKALDETNCKIFQKHTLIVAMYGQGKTRGQITELLIEAATNQACAAIEFYSDEKYFKDFIKLFFIKNYEEIRQLADGGTQPNLNLSKIKNATIPIPPYKEQERIINKHRAISKRLEQMKATQKQKLRSIQSLKSSLLDKAFRGGL